MFATEVQGFDYDFKNLETGQMNELSEAFKVIFGGSDASRIWSFLRVRYPILSIIVRQIIIAFLVSRLCQSNRSRIRSQVHTADV